MDYKDIANGRFYVYTIPISAFSLPTSASEGSLT